MKAEAQVPDNPYILLTPGPLSTTSGVKRAMLQDWCTWDEDYNRLVQEIRNELVRLAATTEGYTAVLMQGSGTFAVEAALITVMPPEGKLLILANGAYGRRMGEIAERNGIVFDLIDFGDVSAVDAGAVARCLENDSGITHVAVVHCETTTGMLNPIEQIGIEVKARQKTFIVDAMSSFGGIPLHMDNLGIDYLISSSNKCIQGVPGFGFVIARRESLEKTKGNASSLSLDLYDQWKTMEEYNGKWRFTSPTHVVRAFYQALCELKSEGGVAARYRRYSENQLLLVEGMSGLGFKTLLPRGLQSPIITTFHALDEPRYVFKRFYSKLKNLGFVIYPGKMTDMETFRIGTIGDVRTKDILRLLDAVTAAL